MLVLNWLGIILACAAYLFTLRKWIYQGQLWPGIFALLVVFPILIALTSTFPAYWLRAIPLVGLGMFTHRYRWRILMQIKLLWFTTLSVLVVQGYYAFGSHFLGLRLWQ